MTRPCAFSPMVVQVDAQQNRLKSHIAKKEKNNQL